MMRESFINDITRARSALSALAPNCNREHWVRIAMSAKAAGLTLEDFTCWSRNASNFADERDCASVWNSVGDGAIGAATLFGMAFEAGWKDPSKRKLSRQAARPTPNASMSPKTRIGAAAAHDFWEYGETAPLTHTYITAKRGRPDGLRIVSETNGMTIAGYRLAGWLMVPAWSLDGELRTLQLIPPFGEGKKLNWPDATFEDGMFIVGDIEQSARIFIVEGIGQAWASWSATGCAAAVSFGAGRLGTVAKALRERFKNARLVIVPDSGKESQAESIAREVRGEWCELPAETPANYDVNDYANEHGTQALAALLQHAHKPSMRYKLLGGADMVTAPPLRWLVRGVLPASGLTCLYGASGSGKSFLALDLCAAVAKGTPWFGRPTNQSPVIYLALEGEAGFRQRAMAWQIHFSQQLPNGLHFVMQNFDLRKSSDLNDLADSIISANCAGGLVVLDTLNRAASGIEENSGADMSQVIDAAKTLQARLGGVVMLVHHTGKDASRGMRGHSSLYAALDAAIEVVRNDNRRSWNVAKSKEDSDGVANAFKLEVVEVDCYEDGIAVTSCVVLPDDSGGNAMRGLMPQGENQRIAYNELTKALRESSNFGAGEAPKKHPCIDLEGAVNIVAGKLTCEVKRRNERARAAIMRLVNRGTYCTDGTWLWSA